MDRVDITYVGDPPILDEFARLRIAMGQIPPEAAKILRGAEIHRTTAVKGVNKRIVDPEHFGTSETYVFGPHDFTVAVKKEDVDKIMSSKSAHQFRLADDPGYEIVHPPSNIKLVSEVEGGVEILDRK